MGLKGDTRAVESLPLKLMIVTIVASMSIVPAAQALEGFQDRDFILRARLQLETLTSAAQTLMVEGYGGVRTIHLDFNNLGHSRFESLTIGDSSDGPNASSAILRMAGGVTMIRTATDPPVWMVSRKGGELFTDSPVFDLRMSAQIDEWSTSVLLELV